MVEAQNADSTWFVNNYIKKEIKITMRDGVNLFTSVYVPKNNLKSIQSLSPEPPTL